MEKINCKLPEPYPEVTSSCHDQHDLAIIRPLYSGTHSELSGILQYSYQVTVLESVCSEVSATLSAISIVEMHHLSLLSGAICTLGGVPKYWNTKTNCWWDASAVNYECNLCKALLCNLKQETDGHRAYLEAAAKVKNPSLAALLRRIAMDEKIHMEIFTSLINCHCRKK